MTSEILAATMQLDAPFPLTPALSLREREHRRPIRIGETVWCMRPRAPGRSKAGSPLRSAPALHKFELNRSGLADRTAAVPESERSRVWHDKVARKFRRSREERGFLRLVFDTAAVRSAKTPLLHYPIF